MQKKIKNTHIHKKEAKKNRYIIIILLCVYLYLEDMFKEYR